MKKYIMTLTFPIRDNQILLGLKKRGFGEGLWNGFGGKVGKDEKIHEAAKRELRQESGIHATFVNKQGLLTFTHTFDDEVIDITVFNLEDFSGQPQETEEMKPQWFNLNDIPYEHMWPDDKHWLPLFLEGKKFKGKFCFNHKGEIEYFTVEDVKKI